MHPELFNLPGLGFSVPAYGFFVALGLILGWFLSLRYAREDQLPAERLGTAYVVAVGVALVCARGLWLLQHPDVERPVAEMVQLRGGEMAAIGGILGAAAVTFLSTYPRQIPFFAWTDCLAPAAMLGLALERFGAFLAGTDFGHLADPNAPWGVSYPIDSPVYVYQRANLSGLTLPSDASMPVHPVQLYGLFVFGLAFVAVSWLRRRRRFSGQITVLAFAAYVLTRMGVEDGFRWDATPAIAGPLSAAHVTAIVLLAFAAFSYRSMGAAARAHPKRWKRWTGGAWSEPAPKR